MAERARKTEEAFKENLVVTPPRSSDDSRSPPTRNPSTRMNHMPSPSPNHRHSFSEQLRGFPSSPRTSRQYSVSHTGGHDLLNNPPRPEATNPAFSGRDWHGIIVGELVNQNDVHFVDIDTGIEEATNLLIESNSSVLLLRAAPTETSATGTFDYKDLNQYLLFATGSLYPDDDHLAVFQDLAKKAQLGKKISLSDAKNLGAKEPFITLSQNASLSEAIEIFGGGVHRIVIVKEGNSEVLGILSQLKLVKFLWENGQSFPIIDQLYPQTLRELNIGSHFIVCVNGDKPLKEALKLMDTEGVSSLAVVDNQLNVVGNISTVDVKLLTKSSSAPLLENTCIHFISVILSSRGIIDGKDSYPVFHVNPYSTLSHTVAKLVATNAHRMWIVDSPSPSTSTPSTPSFPPTIHPPSSPLPLFPPLSTSTSSVVSIGSVSASALPGAHMSGRLSGVVSLTDVLNLFARASGLNPHDPGETRRHRRRSSSSSFVRGSMDSARSSSLSVDIMRR
ncbi:MAG: cell separation during budding [Icmadophila ericetorum]|nr:cell separation during budding [Icmadophila ericetorum]